MRTFVAIAVFGLLAASFVAAQETVTDAGMDMTTRNGTGINGGSSDQCDCNVFETILRDLDRIRERMDRRRDAISQIISRAVGRMLERIQGGSAGGGGVGGTGVGSSGVGSSGVGSADGGVRS